MTKTIRRGFGERIAAVRQEKGLSKLAFARSVLSPRASARNLSRLENEEVSPRARTLETIARNTRIDANWLATGRSPLVDPLKSVAIPGVGARVRAIREQRGMSQRTLAQRASLGASAQNVARIEKAQVRPRGDTVLRLARALGVKPSALLAA